MARPVAAWGSLPFAEQIAFFKDKLDLPTQTWQDLLGSAHDRAFVVAGAMRADLLADLHAAVLKGIERGTSLDEFRRDFDAIVSKRGWTGWTGEDTPGGRAWRQEIIYGTNMRTSYQAGRHAQAVAIAHRRPYWRWRHADTVAHPRPLHVAWDGKILRHDNPWWRSHWPPAGWNCFVPGTQVATPQGWRAIESLVRGDFVIGGSGNVQSVESTQISTFEGNIVRITSKQGNASATPNHRFLTLRGWIRAENLNIGDVLVQISEVSGLDNAISDINHTNTASGKFSVSVPRSRSKPGRMEALNTNIQLWNEDVNPIRKSTVVVDGVKSPFLDYIKHHLLNCGRLCAGIDMGGWVGFVHSKAGTCHLFSDFWSACRRTVFKFLRTTGNASVIVFCFPQAIMSAIRRLMKGCFPQNIGCLFTPSVVSYPLQLDALMGISRIDTEPFHQSHNRPHVAGPSVTKISDSHAFVDIEGSEGFASGSPLDKFDSLDGFVTWARMHGICSTITDIQRVQYNGNVYNLSITEDASYCLRLGVVHNCRCRVETLAERDLERLGKSGPDPTPDDGTYEWIDKAGNSHTIPNGIDPGWDYTPGATRDLIAEVKAKAAGLPEALGKALVEEIAQQVAVETGWHQPPPGKLDDVIERGRLREEELLGVSAKNFNKMLDDVERLKNEGKAIKKKFDDGLITWDEYTVESNAAVAKWRDAKAKLENPVEKILAGMRRQVKEGEKSARSQYGLAIPSPSEMASRLSFRGYSADEISHMKKLAVDFYRQFGVTSTDVTDIINSDSRAWYNAGKVNMGESWDMKWAFFHEFGHGVENRWNIANLCQQWVKRRATGDLKPLNEITGWSIYGPNETAYPDDFIDHYVGKIYRDATEVISVGIQNFTHWTSLLNLILGDREHFRLVLGLLRL